MHCFSFSPRSGEKVAEGRMRGVPNCDEPYGAFSNADQDPALNAFSPLSLTPFPSPASGRGAKVPSKTDFGGFANDSI